MSYIQGASIELGVAAPIKNHKFELGQFGKVQLNTQVSPDSVYLRCTNALYDGANLHNLLQHGDLIVIGASTHTSSLKERENLIISGVEIYNGSEVRIHLRDMNNANYYGSADLISFYGTGLAGGWSIPTTMADFVQAEGIKNGLVSRQLKKSFVLGTTPDPGEYILSGTDPSALIVFKMHTGDYGFGIKFISSYEEYLKSPMNASSLFSFGITNKAAVTGTQYALLGDYHRGGWRKEFAQRLTIKLGTDTTDGIIFKQDLTDFGDSTSQVRDKSLLIPYQYYRLGGKVYLEPKDSQLTYNTHFNLKMRVYPHSSVRESSEYLEVDLLNSSADNVNKWYEFSGVDLLESGLINTESPYVCIYLDNKYSSGETYEGDYTLYIDDLWLETPGGVHYANIDGCLKFSRYNLWPTGGSIEIIEKDVSSNISSKSLKIVRMQFEYATQEFWDDLELIKNWQERGYYLNLHPYIKDLGHILTGRMTIKDYKKDLWDLDYRSFTLEFEELI